MTWPGDTKGKDLDHEARVSEGVGNWLADQLRQSQAVLEQQAERLRKAESLIRKGFARPMPGPRPNPDKPPEPGPVGSARSLQIGECPDSSVWFQIDNNGKWFYLQPRLAELLRYLASKPDAGPGGDGLLGYRTRTEIHVYLEKTGERSYHRQYVNKLVEKLKCALDPYDKRGLVVSCKQGARVLVRRGGVEEVRLGVIPAGRRTGGRRRRAGAGSEAETGLRCSSG
jgi:hypothetical protein